MNNRSKFLIIFIAFFMSVCFIAPQAFAAGPIAKISGVKGDVMLQRGEKFIDVKVGLPVMHGDWVQTKDGKADITFNDGAVMKISHFSSTMVREREEKSGWWIFKKKGIARRITCYVGKLWFKRGASKTKNYMQSPTAVCGVRGSGFGHTPGGPTTYDPEGGPPPEKVGGSFKTGSVPGSSPSSMGKSPAANMLNKARGTGKPRGILGARRQGLGTMSHIPGLPAGEKKAVNKEKKAVEEKLVKLGVELQPIVLVPGIPKPVPVPIISNGGPPTTTTSAPPSVTTTSCSGH